MHIVVLDGHNTNPGDLSWAPLEALGTLTVYDDTPPELVIPRAREADILIYCRITLTREILAQLPRLRYLGTLSTGFNTTDLQAAGERGIPVCNVPSYCENTVAQFAFSLILGLCNHVETHSSMVKDGHWFRSVDLCLGELPFEELSGKTLGLFGYGSIARRVAAMGQAFGMRVLATRRSGDTPGAEHVSPEELFTQSDVISLHCPLTPETRHTVDAAVLAKMKPGALLINTARGAVVDEAAVAQALCRGTLGGYAADVFETEPQVELSPIFTAPRTLLTPHIAWASRPARGRLIQSVADALSAWQNGGLLHCVNSQYL